MANNADGSITIDTELDNSGFDKGSDKLLKSVSNLTNAVDNLGDNMMASFSSVIPLLQSIANSAAGIYSVMTSHGEAAADANQRVADTAQQVAQATQGTVTAVQQQGQAVGQMGADTAQAGQAAQQSFSNVQNTAQQAAQNISQAGQQAQSFGADLGDAVSSSSFKKDVTAASRSCDALSKQLQKIADSARVGFNTDAQMVKFQIQVDKTRDGIAQLKQKLAELGSQRVSTAEFEALAAATQKAEQSLFKLYGRRDVLEQMGVKENTREWERLSIQIRDAERNLARYEAEQAAMTSSGTAYIAGSSTAQFRDMSSTLSEMTSKLSEYEQMAGNFDTISGPASQSESALANVADELDDQPESVSAASVAFSFFGNVLKGLASDIFRVAKGLAQLTFKAIADGAKAATNKLKSFASQSSKTALTSNALIKSLTSLKRLLITRIKRMFISAIFNQMKEAMNTLAQFSNVFDKTMSNLTNSSKQLSANLAVSFGNLLTAIEPILTRIISAISTAISYINALFSMLQGKSTVTVAKKQTASYAASLGDAAAAAKELNRQVYGFDELNKRSSQNSGGGGGGTSPGDLFEEVPIDSLLPDEVKSFFDRIKKAIEAGDWYGVGLIIAEGLNAALGVVDDWINNTLRPQGVKWAERVAQILNGITDGLDWELLGKTIADGMNAAFDIVNTFLTTYNFENLGKGIGRAIKSWFTTIEWDLIGQTFANGWNALIDLVFGLVTTPGIWKTMGESVGTMINNFFGTIKFTKAMSALAQGINGIFTFVSNLAKTIKWGDIARTVYTGLNVAFNTIKWADAGKALSDFFVNLTGTLLEIAKKTDWQALGRGIGEFLSNIDWGTILTNVLQIIWTVLTGLLQGFFSTTAGKVVAGVWLVANLVKAAVAVAALAIGKTLLTNVATAAASMLGFQTATAGVASATGLSLSGMFTTVGGFFSSIASTVASGVTAILGFLGPMGILAVGLIALGAVIALNYDTIYQTMYDFGGKAYDVISQGWSDIVTATDGALQFMGQTITSNFEQCKTTVSGYATAFKTNLSNAWSDIKTNASTTWSNIKTTITTNFNNAKNTVTTEANNIKANMSAAWNGAKASATQAWGTMKSTVVTSLTNMRTNIVRDTQTMVSTASRAWNSIKSAASSQWSTITSNISNAWSNLKNILKQTEWRSIGSNLVAGLLSGLRSAWSSVTSWVSSAAATVTSTLRNALNIHSPSKDWAEIGEYLDAGLVEGLQSSEGTVLSTVSDLAKNVTDGMSTEIPSLEMSEGSVVNGLDAVTDRLSGIATIFQTISDMLNGLGGLTVPQIAAGTVVPYKTKVDATPADEPPTDPLSALSDGVDERMADQTYVLRQILDVIRKLNLNIDLDALTQAITKQQRDRQLNFGGV